MNGDRDRRLQHACEDRRLHSVSLDEVLRECVEAVRDGWWGSRRRAHPNAVAPPGRHPCIGGALDVVGGARDEQDSLGEKTQAPKRRTISVDIL